jgi:TolB-like protein/Flp pilus assembly protein TadD
MTRLAGTRLGPYEIVSLLGAGGMGEVYRARDERLDRDVAIKVLPAEALGDSAARSRLLREARSVAALNHPNVCTIHEVGESQGQAYIAMELVEGKPLDLLIPSGGLPVERVLDYGLQIADAVAHAHERGIVHRDLKPSNALVTPQGRVKVLDFGLAKRVLREDLSEASTATQGTLTQAGAVVGTLPYMAPEQLLGEAADARSDVWSLGVVLYEMAAGVRPFKGQTGFEVSSAILKERPAPLAGELGRVVEKCLEKEPDKRFQGSGEVHAALKQVESGAVTRPRAVLRIGFPRGRWAAAGGVLFTLLALLIGFDVGGLRRRLAGGFGATRAIRMAVLPFANLSGDPEQEYLSDGVTQEMIAQLGRLHPETLSVIARTSVMRYKKTDTPIDRIGRELGVDYVLEGSAQREAGRIRISAELIAVKTQTQLWAESYERELSGILALQSDVAQKVAGALALKLLPAERTRLAKVRAVDPEAYEAYLKGKFYLNKMTEEGYEKGLAYLHQAVEKDPNSPLPYAALALGYSLIGHERHPDAFAQARIAARKAEELGGEPLAEMYLAFGMIELCSDWNYPGAEKDFRRALDLDPSIGEAHRWYSWYLFLIGRREEALARMKRAEEADPLTPLFHADRGWQYWWTGQNDKAIEEARKSLELDPAFNEGLHVLGAVFAEKGMFAEAIAAHQKLAAADPDWRWSLTRTYAQAGRKDEARKTLARFLAEEPKAAGGWAGWFLAETYAALGDKDEAFRWLEAAYRERHSFMPWINDNLAFASLRSDPRFHDLQRRLKLPG